MSSELTLKCKCGAFEATFDAPPRLTFNCHCHSCVAAIAAIESKEGFEGTTCKSDTGEHGGVAIAIYKSNNVTVKTADAEKISFVKVGAEGKISRPYCTSCGTVLFNVFQPNWVAANRNAMTNTADGSAFEPAGKVTNVNAKAAYDSSKVPDPKHGSVPVGTLLKFIPLIAGVFCDGSNKKEKALIPEDMDKVEVVPITWE